MPTGPNRDAVTIGPNTEAEAVPVDQLHPGDATHPEGAWIHTAEGVLKHVEGGLIHWGNGVFRPTQLPEKWHVNASGEVDAGE